MFGPRFFEGYRSLSVSIKNRMNAEASSASLTQLMVTLPSLNIMIDLLLVRARRIPTFRR